MISTLMRSAAVLLACLLVLVFPIRLPAQEAQPPSPIPTRLTLELATEVLLARNPTLLRERQNVAIARAGLVEARLRPNPDFELVSESYPLFESNPGPFFQRNELIVRVGQPIETAGKRRKRTQVAEQDVAAAGFLLQDTIRQLKLELKIRYYRLALAKAEYELAREVLSQFDEIIRLNQVRYQQGEVSGLDLARVETERLRFFNDVVVSELQLQNAKTALLELLGVTDMTAEFDVAETLTFRPLAVSVETLEEQALVARADLQARRALLERERRQVTFEKAQAVPNLIPFFGYKRNLADNTVTFGVNLGLPFFNRNQGGIARAAARVNQAGYEQQRTELVVRRELRQAYQAVQAGERQVRALESTYVAKARQARDIAQAAYRLGALDLIAFLDAERAYRETLRGYYQALFDHWAAIFLLEAAVGKEL